MLPQALSLPQRADSELQEQAQGGGGSSSSGGGSVADHHSSSDQPPQAGDGVAFHRGNNTEWNSEAPATTAQMLEKLLRAATAAAFDGDIPSDNVDEETARHLPGSDLGATWLAGPSAVSPATQSSAVQNLENQR